MSRARSAAGPASMTGCGSGRAADARVQVDARVSSVNRKQLDVQVNLPRDLAALETRVTQAVQRAAARGRVQVDIAVRRRARGAPAVRVDTALARAYLGALRRAARALGLRDDLGAARLLELPDVLRYERVEADARRVGPVLDRALRAALGRWNGMRRREGAALRCDLEARRRGLERRLAAIRRRAPAATERHRRRLLERLRGAGLAADPADPRLLQELALFADRTDIAEELTRLASHLAQARDVLRAGGATGRTLDFLVQEMMREINTVGAKANDGAIAAQVVACKAELERLREQAQNIE